MGCVRTSPWWIAKEDGPTWLEISVDENFQYSRNPFGSDVFNHIIENNEIVLFVDWIFNNVLHIKCYSGHIIFPQQFPGNSDMIRVKIKCVHACTQFFRHPQSSVAHATSKIKHVLIG